MEPTYVDLIDKKKPDVLFKRKRKSKKSVKLFTTDGHIRRRTTVADKILSLKKELGLITVA